MNLWRLTRSFASLCALAAPLLYVVVNLISLQMAAHPTGLHPNYEVPWNHILLDVLDKEIATARKVTLGISVVLAVEAFFLVMLDRIASRPTAVLILMGVAYESTLTLATWVNPASGFWELNDDSDLAFMVPAWHGPALITLAIVTLPVLIIWLSARARRA